MDPPADQSHLGSFMPLQFFTTPSNTQYAQMESQPQSTAPSPSAGEQNYARKYTAKDWITHQAEITRLYENSTLENVRKHMKTHYKLDATPKQYKDRFKKWGINKHVQSDEMKAIIRIQQKRAADSQQPKNTAFRVRKKPVHQGKIDRYIKEHSLQSLGVNPDDMDINMSPAATPSAVSYYTPSNTGPPSPPAAPFSPKPPSSATYQFGDPAPALPNSPVVARMADSFNMRSPLLMSVVAWPSFWPSSQIELDERTFTGQRPAPFSGLPTFHPQDYNAFQRVGMEFIHQVVLSEDYMAQSFYGTPSSFPPLFQTAGLSQSYHGEVSDMPDVASSRAADLTTMPLSEVCAAMLLFVGDALIVDQCEVAPKHINTHDIMYELAVALKVRGRYGTAEQIQRHTLEVRQNVLGTKHPETLRSMHELAVVLCSQGRHETALNMHQRTLELGQDVLSLTHFDMIDSMRDLAMELIYQGKYKAAEQLMHRSLDGFKKLRGKELPHMLKILTRLANVFFNRDMYAISEQTLRQRVSAFEKVFGKQNPNTLTSLKAVLLLLRDDGKLKAA